MDNKNVSSQLALCIKHKPTRVNRALDYKCKKKMDKYTIKAIHEFSVKKGNFVYESH
jgi:molybdenum cofactor biosynthesis enzyme